MSLETKDEVNFNITTPLIELYQNVKSSWTEDLFGQDDSFPATAVNQPVSVMDNVSQSLTKTLMDMHVSSFITAHWLPSTCCICALCHFESNRESIEVLHSSQTVACSIWIQELKPDR